MKKSHQHNNVGAKTRSSIQSNSFAFEHFDALSGPRISNITREDSKNSFVFDSASNPNHIVIILIGGKIMLNIFPIWIVVNFSLKQK